MESNGFEITCWISNSPDIIPVKNLCFTCQTIPLRLRNVRELEDHFSYIGARLLPDNLTSYQHLIELTPLHVFVIF